MDINHTMLNNPLEKLFRMEYNCRYWVQEHNGGFFTKWKPWRASVQYTKQKLHKYIYFKLYQYHLQVDICHGEVLKTVIWFNVLNILNHKSSQTTNNLDIEYIFKIWCGYFVWFLHCPPAQTIQVEKYLNF